MNKDYIFIPFAGGTTTEQSLFDVVAGQVAITLGDQYKQRTIVIKGDASGKVDGTPLAEVAEQDTVKLYVVGHGNWGDGVGSHTHHLTADKLAQKLVDMGLKNARVQLEIHLMSCNSGVALRKYSALWRKEPFGLRFARKLGAKGAFVGTQVIGVSGFLNASNMVSRTMTSFRKQTIDFSKTAADALERRNVVYTITANGVDEPDERWKGSGLSKVDIVART